MLGQENIREQVAVSQMDVDELSNGEQHYEDRLTSEIECKLSCEFQDNPGPSSANSDSHHSELADDESVIETANAASDKVIIEEVAKCFAQTFVKEFEKKVREYSEEAKPNSNMRKSGKLTATADSVIKSSVGPGVHLPSFDLMSSGGQILYAGPKKAVDSCLEKRHRERAKVISKVIHSFKCNQREVLVKAGLEIFQKFEEQFTRVIDVGQYIQRGSEERAIQKLAIDAAYRVMDYASDGGNVEESFFGFITKGVVLGKSKRETVAKSLHLRPAGCRMQDRQSGETWLTSTLYKSVGIEKIGDGTTEYYQLKKYSCGEKYGYRLAFPWELEECFEVGKNYKLIDLPNKKSYVRTFNDEKKEKLAPVILKELNEQDLINTKAIVGIEEHLRRQDENRCQFSYNFGEIVEFFIERKKVIKELNLKLHSKSQEIKMSRIVLINGKSGVGKTEFVRGYGFSERRKGTWEKIIWIDALEHATLKSLFSNLAGRLGIPTKESEGGRDIDIESIVENVYRHLQHTKSFFVFDRASSYEEIERFLPANFPSLLNGERPFIVITSNKSWQKESIEEIELGNFDPKESDELLRKALEKNESQDDISKLGKALNYHPFALAQAAASINQRGESISSYRKKYKTMQKSSELQGDNGKSFGILKINIGKVKEEKNIGPQSYAMLEFMAYLNSYPINIKEIFFPGKSKENQKKIWYALGRLDSYSLIHLKKGIAQIHQTIQEFMRLRQKEEGKEEETLRQIIISLRNSNITTISHIVSVWNHASKYSNLVNEFIDSIYDEGNILHLLAKDCNKEVIKLVLQKADTKKLSKVIDAVDAKGVTALEYAIISNQLDVVKCLVEHGADVNLLDKGGTSPLCVAAEQGSLDIVKYLIEEANVSLLDEDNASSLHYAIVEEELDIIRYLVEHGANVNLPDKDGMTPLYVAIEQRSLGIIEYLVEHGADVNLLDEDGMSPLSCAVGGQGLGIIKYLVEHGANVNLLDVDAKSVYSRFLEKNLDRMKEREEPAFSDQDAKRESLGSVYFEVRDPVRLFTGREKELEELHRMLQHNQEGLSVISQIKSVSGLGGIGKTQLMRKYVQKYAKVYDENIVWINAGTEAILGQSFFDLARDNRLGICSIDRDKSAKPIKSIVKEIYSFFAKRKSLFIFDNVDNIQHLKEFLPLSVLRLSDERPYILITSRNQQWEDSMSCLRLGGLSLKDAVTFVKSGLGIEDELQNKGIEDLVIDLQFFPLAIQQAISYIRYHHITGKLSIVDYLVQYHEKKKDLLDSTIFQDIDNEYAKTTFTTWDMTFDKIKNNKEYGDLALEVLYIMAYLGSENINRRMFVGLAGRDESKLKSAVHLLVGYSIVSGQKEQSILSIHKLVQEVVMIKLADKHRSKEVMKRAVRLMNDICSSSESSSSTESFLLHQKVLLSRIDSWIVKNPQDRNEMLQDSLASLLLLLGNEYFKIYELEEAVEWFKRVLEIEEAFDDKNIVKVIEATMDLGRVYKALEKYAEQERILSQIEHSVRNIYKPESSEGGKLGEFLIELGEVRQVLGGFDKRNIKNLLEEGSSILEKVYGEENTFDYYELGDAFMSLSKAYEALGDYDEQAKSLDKALVIFSECYGEDSFEAAEVQVKIAKVCVILKKYHEARNHIQEAIDSLSFYRSDNGRVYKLSCSINKFSNFFGLDSDGIAEVEVNGIEDIVLNLEKDSLKEAYGLVILSKVSNHSSDLKFYCIEEAIEIFEKYYQEGDYKLAKELINLADAYGYIGQPLEQEKVIQERVLPVLLCEGSCDVSYTIARARLSLAKSWELLGKYEEQLKLLTEEVLPFFVGKYGNKHFEVAEIQLSIAVVYGRLEKNYAKQINLIEETVLPVFEELDQSPRIVNVLVTLGEAYGHLNNYEKRADCLQNALRRWRLFNSLLFVPLYNNNMLSAEIIVSLSETYGILKQYNKQADLLVEALEIFKKHYDPSNKEIIKVLVMMAQAYRNLNRYDRAIKVLSDSFRILNDKSVYDINLERSDQVIKFLVDYYLDQQSSLQCSKKRKRTLDSSSPEHSWGKKTRKERSLGVSCIDPLDDELENDNTMEKLKNTKEFYNQLLKFSERVSGRGVVDIEESLFTRIENIDLNLIDPEIRDIVREMRGNVRKEDGVKNVLRRSGVAEKIGKVAESANLAFTTFLLGKHPVNGDGRLEVDGAKQMNLEPQSYLSNASVQGHSKVSTCLSDIGVTKLVNNLSR